MIEVGEVGPGLPLVAVDAGSAMRLAASLAALGAVAEAAGWAVSLAVDAGDGAISLQVRRGAAAADFEDARVSDPEPVSEPVAERGASAEPDPDAVGGALVSDPEPDPEAAGLPALPNPCRARKALMAVSPAEGKRRHRGSAERIRQQVWTCLREDPSTGPELMQLVGASRPQIQAAVNWLAEAGRVTSSGLGWEGVTWRPVERFAVERAA